jgi:hypothetical protein
MKEKPILFSGAMVRAIEAGTKTQTRRVITPQPVVSESEANILAEAWDCGFIPVACPYGSPGQRLWVRETLNIVDFSEYSGACVQYAADRQVRGWSDDEDEVSLEWGSPRGGIIPPGDGPVRVIPSIHMPRWASRITLEVTGVRCERLHDIGEADAIAEGCKEEWGAPYWSGHVRGRDNFRLGISHGCGTDGKSPASPELENPERHPAWLLSTARESYASLWSSINGKNPAKAWAANPWVFVVEFRRSA